MSEEHIVRYSPGDLVPEDDRTDWKRVRAMTEEEIEANALSDPDAQPWTDEELQHATMAAEFLIRMEGEELQVLTQLAQEKGVSIPTMTRMLLRQALRTALQSKELNA